MIDIKACVKNKEVQFEYYRDGSLWYSTTNGDIFPVPVNDIGTATFNKKEKAILLMRWMRKWNESLAK